MSATKINDLVHEASTRLIYVYDFLNMWTFFVELAEIVEEAESADYPNLMFVQGQVPDEAPIKNFEAEKLDAQVAPGLKTDLVVLKSEGVKNIIIDMSNTRYCDSSGLSAILIANRLCKEANGSFVLCGVQEESFMQLVTTQEVRFIDCCLKLS